MSNFSDFARQLGVSRQTAYDYRASGMPTDSVEGARAWVAARKASDGRGGKRATGGAGSQFLTLKEALLRANVSKTEAEARLRGYEAEQANRNLVSLDEAKAYIAEILAPLRVLLDSLPKACAIKANPSDPQLAEDAIREAVDGIYKAMDRVKEDAANVA